MFFVVTLATTDNLNTPVVYYVTTEISVPWAWEFTVACTSNRRCINGENDQQGVTPKDLYYLLRNAWENGTEVSYTHPNGTVYTCAIESLEAMNPSPAVGLREAQVVPYEEYFVRVLLRQSV
jgi:hypothetical protein